MQLLEDTRSVLAIAVVVGGIALLALKEWLRATFMPLPTDPEQRFVTVKAFQELADATADDLDGVGRKVERMEKFTLAMQDAIADNRGRYDKLANDVQVVRQYGSIPMQEVLKDQRKILRRLDQIAIHMKLPIPDEDV